MNCRRVCGLLSAYLDSELPLNEIDLIAVHLNECPYCRGEYQSLLDTKRLLASLAHRASRAEIESLLQAEEDQRFTESGSGRFFRNALRPKPLTATALLSLAGLWVASASLDSPADGIAPGASGFSSPLSAATMPGFGMGVRGLRYLNDMVHNGPSSATMISADTDGLVMSPESPYAMPVSEYGGRYRHSISLNNVLSANVDNRNTPTSGSTYSTSVSTASGGSSVSIRMSGSAGSYSLSMQRVVYVPR